jgi:flagellum-specific ATP synthase
VNLKASTDLVRSALAHRPRGTIVEVSGLIVEVGGIKAAIGDSLRVPRAHNLRLEVVGFKKSHLLTTPLGSTAGLRPGTDVELVSHGGVALVGDELLGRVVDAFGRPLDGLGAPRGLVRTKLDREPPDAFARKPIRTPLATSVRAIDGLLPLGVGQRVGIFAGSGVGKSTLLGMICRGSSADINVIGLIGERGRELNEFIRQSLGEEGLQKSVVVAATSDQAPLVRARGAETATAIAEYFRDQGKSVLLVMDSVTRYAMALREVALAAGEPPATKGYPPSVFAALPRLLERTGTSPGQGVITALYTVLVEGDDLSDPIADTVRGVLDGHIVLSRRLAEKGHFPAIDVAASVSRLATEVATKEHLTAAARFRELSSVYREALDLIQVGAYTPGSDPRVDEAIRLAPSFDALLRQRTDEKTKVADTLAVLTKLVAGKPR